MAEELLQWVVMAALTAATAFALLAPLGRRRGAAPAHAADLAIYRDQLAETERDTRRGLIGPREAAAARIEIARRVLKTGALGEPHATASPVRARIAMVAVLAALPALAISVYVAYGAPGRPDLPLAARLSAPDENAEFAVLVRRVEAHLATSPEDGQGWLVIAPAYVGLGRYDDAAAAYRNAIRILGSTADRQAGLGQALMFAAQGLVTADAQAAFAAAAAADPSSPVPRYYLALGLTQEGRRAEAEAAWQALLADAPEGAAWAASARQQLAALSGAAAPAAAPGPTPAEVAAASQMDAGDRTQMIEGMVASLAERLKSQPDDLDGWTRLIRSYVVLGRTGDATAALAGARAALSGSPEKVAAIDAAARSLDLIP